ncbi:MAG: FG-GAP repeat domain-containing protein [Gemmatimonadales bacterium]
MSSSGASFGSVAAGRVTSNVSGVRARQCPKNGILLETWSASGSVRSDLTRAWSWRAPARVTFGESRGAVYGFAVGDLDGDGYLDIAAARSEAPNMVYFGDAGNPRGR